MQMHDRNAGADPAECLVGEAHLLAGIKEQDALGLQMGLDERVHEIELFWQLALRVM